MVYTCDLVYLWKTFSEVCPGVTLLGYKYACLQLYWVMPNWFPKWLHHFTSPCPNPVVYEFMLLHSTANTWYRQTLYISVN